MPEYDLGTARGRIELDASSLGRATAALSGLGKSLIGFSVVAGGALAYAVKSSADLEKTLSAVKAVTGATEAQIDQLRETSLNLATDSAFAAGEIASSFEDLGKAGISVENILGGAAEATIRLAEAAGDELPGGVSQGAEIMANAMKVFDVSSDQAMHFADVLVAAAASSTLSVDDIATSMRYAGPPAAALGFTIDDLSTALAILGDRGIKGSTAGTSLRGVLLSLAGPSKKASGVMKDLGLMTEDGTNAFFDMDGALKPLPEVMQLLGDATRDLSQEQRAAAFNAIFQRRAMNAAMILADQGAEGFYEYAESIGALSAADVAAEKLDNLSGDVTKLKNTADSFIKRVGYLFQDVMRGWVQALTRVIDRLNTLSPELLKMVVTAVAVAAAFAGIFGILALLASGFLRIYVASKLLAEAFVVIRSMVGLLTATLLRSPWALIIGVIAGLAYVLYRAYKRGTEFTEIWDRWFDTFDRYSGFVLKFFRDFAQAVDNLITAFLDGELTSEQFGDVMDGVFGGTGKYTPFFEGLYNGVSSVFNWIRDNAIKISGWFVDAVGGIENVLLILGGLLLGLISPWLLVAGAIAWAYQNVGWFRDAINAIPGVLSAVWEALKTFGGVIVGVAQMAWNAFRDFLTWLWSYIGPIFAAAGEVIVAFWDLIFPFFDIFWNLAKAAFDIVLQIIDFFVRTAITFWELFGDNIVRVFEIAWNFVKGILEGIFQVILGILQVFAGIFTGDWGKIWEGVKNIASGIWKIIFTILKTAWDLIVLAFQTIIDILIFAWRVGWDLIKTVFRLAWDAIKALASAAWQALQVLWDNFLDTIGKLAGEALDALARLWNRVWQEIGDFLRTALRAIIDFVVTKLGEFVDYWAGVPGAVVDALAAFGGMVLGVFSEAMSSVWDAVTSKGAELLDWFGGLGSKVVNAIGDLGSTMADIGRDIIQGMINGVRNMAGNLASAARDAVGGAIDAAKSVLRIGSPSRVFKEIGEWTGEGFVEGMRSMITDAARISEQLTGATIPSTLPGASSGSVTRNSTSMTIGHVTIQAQDLAEVNSVEQLFTVLSDAALQGVNRHG